MKLPLVLGLAVASLATPALADHGRYDRGDRYRHHSSSRPDWSINFGFGGGGYRDYSYVDLSIGNRGGNRGGYRGSNLCDWPAPQPVRYYEPVAYQPAPVYCAPQPVYCPPVYYSPPPVYRCDPYVTYGGYGYRSYGRGGYRCD